MTDKVVLILMRLFLINKTHSHYSPITSEWIQTKWEFFKTDCLRSIRSQTNKDFKLVVLVDERFPHYNEIRNKVEAEANTGLFDLQYVDFQWGDGHPFSQAPFPRDIANFTRHYIRKNYPHCSWLITARLDGDDILAKDYVDMVWRNKRSNEGWLIFKNGYYFHGDDFVTHDTYNNAHLIYMEPFSDKGRNIKTVYHRMHNKLGYQGPEDKRFTVIETDRGLWADRIGENTNVKKDGKYMQHMRRFTVHRDKLKTPIEKIREDFELA